MSQLPAASHFPLMVTAPVALTFGDDVTPDRDFHLVDLNGDYLKQQLLRNAQTPLGLGA